MGPKKVTGGSEEESTQVYHAANWEGITRLVTALTPILLAALTYFTIKNGKTVEEAAVLAQKTAEVVIKGDSSRAVTLDTIHAIVNSQRTALELVNKQLREALTEAGIKQPQGTEEVPRK